VSAILLPHLPFSLPCNILGFKMDIDYSSLVTPGTALSGQEITPKADL
jgi:hypothetical protein